MFNWNKCVIFSLLILSTMISVTSHSWLGIWMGLEVNLMMFIPLIIDNKNMFMSEAMLSYFIVQTLTSINLLFFIFFMKMNSQFMWFTSILMNFSLLMKMGAAPFHFWFPKVMSGLSWMNCLILSTWQKITPMIAISLCINNSCMLISIFFSAIIGAMGGINQTSIRSLISFSSINHMSWMLTSIMLSMSLWTIYFIIYFIMNLLIIFMLNANNLFYMNQLFNYKINSMIFLSFFMNLFSLGGLPPFLGFFPKWLIVLNMNIYSMNYMIFFMMMMTLITLSFYINMMMSSLIISYSQIKWVSNFYNKNFYSVIFFSMSFSFFGLILISLMKISF
uniref:NADH dehydrogenase subunit 2 n=1 Tax=Lispe assimilis TaxID=1670692 RepID=UPI001D02B2D3|nr:NADH dehydrogenase subunit 2 [Lispe assimilis]QVG62673.1 NADH dehydrogenase subunit 2 [Lispe assimilis]